MIQTRSATPKDIKSIMLIINQAKAYLKNQGVDQWQTGYPNEESIQADVAAGIGYVFTDNEQIAAYACITFEPEEFYNHLQGQWKSNLPYAAIHRAAVNDAYRGQGLSDKIFAFAQELCISKGVHSIKVDTDNDNATMKHILQKNGFEYCGIVCFDNSDKIAFEKLF